MKPKTKYIILLFALLVLGIFIFFFPEIFSGLLGMLEKAGENGWLLV